MTEKFHLKIKWRDYEKTDPLEIILFDDGQPLCQLISVDDARLVRDILNYQERQLKYYREEE